MVNENKAVYINVGECVDIRKDILHLNINIINLMKKYEYLKEIRNNKQKGFIILKELLKELNDDFSKLRNELPSIQPKTEERAKLRVEETKFEVKHIKVNKELSALEKEMQRLRLKLREIE